MGGVLEHSGVKTLHAMAAQCGIHPSYCLVPRLTSFDIEKGGGHWLKGRRHHVHLQKTYRHGLSWIE
jgi:hypothetical protein